eukprot:5069032-Amphidinium_carterae.1
MAVWLYGCIVVVAVVAVVVVVVVVVDVYVDVDVVAVAVVVVVDVYVDVVAVAVAVVVAVVVVVVVVIVVVAVVVVCRVSFVVRIVLAATTRSTNAGGPVQPKLGTRRICFESERFATRLLLLLRQLSSHLYKEFSHRNEHHLLQVYSFGAAFSSCASLGGLVFGTLILQIVPPDSYGRLVLFPITLKLELALS